MLKSQQDSALQKAPRSRPYSCNVCPKQFETPSKLARHYLTHTGQKPFRCDDCSKTFRQLVHLERHMMTHTRPFRCNICHRHFKSDDTFSKHQRMHAEGARLKARVPRKAGASRRRRFPSVPLYCFGCQRTFESEEKRLLHQCDFVNVTANRNPEIQQCDLCDKVFPSRSKLERHVMIHTGQKPFACVSCGKSFRQKAHLKIHELTHTQEKPFRCSECYRSFKTPEQLLKHEEGHATVLTIHKVDIGISPEPLQVKEEPDDVVCVIQFHCPSCELCFDSQEALDGHTCDATDALEAAAPPVKRGDRKKLKICSIYLDPQNDSEARERHLKTERPEEAEDSDPNELECREITIPRNVLQLRPQQKAKPCKKRSRRLLGRHLRKQHSNADEDRRSGDTETARGTPERSGQIRDTFHRFLQQAHSILMPMHKMRRCDRCEKSFPSMSKLRRHYLTHTGQKPFSCGECGKTFRQSAHLKRHQVTHTEKDCLYSSHISLGDYNTFDQWQENPGYQLHQNSCRSVENGEDFDEIAFTVPEIKVEVEAPEVIKKPAVRRTRLTSPRVRNRKSGQERAPQKTSAQCSPKRYRCTVCAKSFLSPSKLERHHLTHSGQRPFVCQECGKSFRQDPHLKRHMVTHIKATE